jgi:hypothetical protein
VVSIVRPAIAIHQCLPSCRQTCLSVCTILAYFYFWPSLHSTSGSVIGVERPVIAPREFFSMGTQWRLTFCAVSRRTCIVICFLRTICRYKSDAYTVIAAKQDQASWFQNLHDTTLMGVADNGYMDDGLTVTWTRTLRSFFSALSKTCLEATFTRRLRLSPHLQVH